MDEENKKIEESTKEINLSDLYDGSINSTVIMDPVTQNEVLIKEKKRYGIIFIVIIIVVLILGAYFIYFNTDLIKKDPVVKPKVTPTSTKKNINDEITGDLNCVYTNDDEQEKLTSNIKFVIINSNVKLSDISINVISKIDTLSANAKNILDTYEKFYINNVSVIGNESQLEKNDKSFSLTMKLDYEMLDFESFILDDENIKLVVKPNHEDSYYSLSDNYVNLGYSCTLTRGNNEKYR